MALKTHCTECKELFKFGDVDDPTANVYSLMGHRETQISGMCEVCFDSLFEEDE